MKAILLFFTLIHSFFLCSSKNINECNKLWGMNNEINGVTVSNIGIYMCIDDPLNIYSTPKTTPQNNIILSDKQLDIQNFNETIQRKINNTYNFSNITDFFSITTTELPTTTNNPTTTTTELPTVASTTTKLPTTTEVFSDNENKYYSSSNRLKYSIEKLDTRAVTYFNELFKDFKNFDIDISNWNLELMNIADSSSYENMFENTQIFDLKTLKSIFDKLISTNASDPNEPKVVIKFDVYANFGLDRLDTSLITDMSGLFQYGRPTTLKNDEGKTSQKNHELSRSYSSAILQ